MTKGDLIRAPMFGKSLPFISDTTYNRRKVLCHNKWVRTEGVKNGSRRIMQKCKMEWIPILYARLLKYLPKLTNDQS
jgi:hypothetical protein